MFDSQPCPSRAVGSDSTKNHTTPAGIFYIGGTEYTICKNHVEGFRKVGMQVEPLPLTHIDVVIAEKIAATAYRWVFFAAAGIASAIMTIGWLLVVIWI